jgi:hypothetical protein
MPLPAVTCSLIRVNEGSGTTDNGVYLDDLTFETVVTTPPGFQSTPPAEGECGQPYGYAPQVSGTGPFTFSARAVDGGALPSDLTVDAGVLAWTPSLDSTELFLDVIGAGGVATQHIAPQLTCRRDELWPLGSACSASGGWPALALVALLRRRRAQR